MPQIFICYRRKDSQDVTYRIRDRLLDMFQPRDVFIDVHSIAAGVDYRDDLRKAFGQCQAVLVVIGDRWLNLSDALGQRRLDLPDDDVRIEIEMALRLGLLVIPLLVGSASMPCETDLPESIRPLAKKQARQVRPDPDFDRDIDRLLAELPVDDRVAALRSFSLRAGPMLQRIQVGQQDLRRFARELSDAPNQLMSNTPMSGPSPRFAMERARQLEAILAIQEAMSGVLEHTTPFVNFAYFPDPPKKIGQINIAEVDQRFRELQAETQRGTRWADDLLGTLHNPSVPDDLARRGSSLVAELRDQIKMVQSETDAQLSYP